MQNVCDGGAIKHGSDFSCVCDLGHTVNPLELFAMRRNNRNRQPDEGVCDIHMNRNIFLGFIVCDVHTYGNDFLGLPCGMYIPTEMIFSDYCVGCTYLQND